MSGEGDGRAELDGAPAAESEDVDPLERGKRQLRFLLPVVLAPLGLATAIFLSLMVAGWHVERSAVIHAEPVWLPGEALAVRAQLVDGQRRGVPGAELTLSFARPGEAAVPLLEVGDGDDPGITQGRFTCPDVPPGPAEMIVALRAPGLEPVSERVPVLVAAERAARKGTHTVSSSNLNWGDDTEPQPANVKINVRPIGRLLAGFDNHLVVRVTDPEGRAHAGEVEVVLTHGEFMGQVGREHDGPVLARARPDRLGLLSMVGPFTSEVLGLEVRAFAPVREGGEVEHPEAKELAEPAAKGDIAADPGAGKPETGAGAGAEDEPAEGPKPVATRSVRMVSYAGAVRAAATPLGVRAGDEIELHARPLRATKSVYADIHGPDGVWIDTVHPPFAGREPGRPWSTAGVGEGIVQVEAYSFTNAPGESAAVARFQVTDGDPGAVASLEPLIERQRAGLDVIRVERDFDAELERAHLGRILSAELSREEVETARAWLSGTLPVHVIEPPLAVSTRVREEATVRARKHAWNSGIRLLLLVGGGGFLLLITLFVLRSHGQVAQATTRALLTDGDESPSPETSVEEMLAVRAARRQILARGAALILSMGMGLVLTVIVLDRLVWEFESDAPAAPASADRDAASPGA